MVLFFVVAGSGWAVTSILLYLVEVAFKRLFPLGEPKYLVMLNLLIGGLIVLCLYYFLTPYVINTFSTVYASGAESDTEETPKLAPFMVSVANDVAGEYSFDIRNVTDAALVGVVGKVAVSAMSHAPTVSGKVALGVTTTLSLGAVAAGFKAMNAARKNLPHSEDPADPEDRPPSPTNDNFAINSPLEESSSENLMVVFQMVQLLLGLALILFLLFVFLLWLKTKLDTVEIKSISSFWSLSEDLAEWAANGIKKFLDKSLKFYLTIFTILILFNMSFALYFITEMAEFLSVFRF